MRRATLLLTAIVYLLSGCDFGPTDIEVEEFCIASVTEYDVAINMEDGSMVWTPLPLDTSDPEVIAAIETCKEENS